MLEQQSCSTGDPAAKPAAAATRTCASPDRDCSAGTATKIPC